MIWHKCLPYGSYNLKWTDILGICSIKNPGIFLNIQEYLRIYQGDFIGIPVPNIPKIWIEEILEASKEYYCRYPRVITRMRDEYPMNILKTSKNIRWRSTYISGRRIWAKIRVSVGDSGMTRIFVGYPEFNTEF